MINNIEGRALDVTRLAGRVRRQVCFPVKWGYCLTLLWLTLTLCFGSESPVERFSLDEAYDRPWQVTSYAVDSGLTYQRVFDIDFEKNGTVWLAASDGLRRYNGYEWQYFGTNEGLPSSFVRSVHVTQSGELWVGSDAGVGVFNWTQKTYDPKGSGRGLSGPNVRQIIEDPDATLWFCCDQWPDTSNSKGGLTAYRNGKWTSYGIAQGLPMDYVINYFRDSSGRQFAMTPHGWVERQGERWGAPQDPGYGADDRILMMAEGQGGTLFAQGERALLMLTNGQWQVIARDSSSVCSTSQKDILSVNHDESRGLALISVWDGQGFEKCSGSFPVTQEGHIYKMRQAPDGSIWCVGSGMVIRWEFRASNWKCYPNLPAPKLCDSVGRLWFFEKENVVVRRNNRLEKVPQISSLLAVDQKGGVWASGNGSASNKLVFAPADHLENFKPINCRMSQIRNVLVDPQGPVWIVGKNEDQRTAISCWDGTNWLNIGPSELKNRGIQGVEIDPVSGFWFITDTMDYEIAHVDGAKVLWQSLKPQRPPLTYAKFAIGAGCYWLQGYDGLYQRKIAGEKLWTRVDDFPDRGFRGILGGKDETVFLFGGGRGGKPGCAFYRDGAWTLKYGSYNCASSSRDKKSMFISIRGGIYIRSTLGGSELKRLPLPVDTYVNNVVEDGEHTLWIGTAEGVFHYRPDRRAPRTTLRNSVAEVQENGSLWVLFGGIQRFAGPVSGDAFLYSWRFDGGPWTQFSERRGNLLSVQGLTPGAHLLEARAQDAYGNTDPAAARLQFTVLPKPIQQRPWFKPLVIVLTGVILSLGWVARTRARETIQHNKALEKEIAERRKAELELQKTQEELERRVSERTIELAQTNQSLSREITERTQAEATRKNLEEQLRQSQKIESIGTMAGGIAHDFNNILAVIIPNTHIAIEDAHGNPAVLESLQQVLVAADRAADLVRQILAFSRQQKQQKEIIDLQPLVKETLKLMRSALPANVEILHRMQPEIPPVCADSTQIHQVLMNLCSNAGHAIRRQRGFLKVLLEKVELTEANVLTHPDLQHGIYVRMTVADNGCGMSDEVLKRIFDPFFTTKAPGKGTGLGLAVVHGIVKDHGGAILVSSEVGKGSRFEIYLPAYTGELPPAIAAAKTVTGGQGQRILLVDDESSICNILKTLLTRNGYSVDAFNAPGEAIETFNTNPNRYDLVFTDLSMPDMTGLEMAVRMRKLSPDLPVIVMTGFGGAWAPDATQLSGVVKIIEKPIAPSLILETIQQAFEETSQSSQPRG